MATVEEIQALRKQLAAKEEELRETVLRRLRASKELPGMLSRIMDAAGVHKNSGHAILSGVWRINENSIPKFNTAIDKVVAEYRAKLEGIENGDV